MSALIPEDLDSFDPPRDGSGAFDLRLLNVEDLLELRAEIERRLPVTSLANVNMEQELVLQMVQLKGILAKLTRGENTDPAKLTPAMNALSSLLQTLSKLQTEIYSSERVKAMESALIKALQAYPEDLQKGFLDTYERLYAASRQ